MSNLTKIVSQLETRARHLTEHRAYLEGNLSSVVGHGHVYKGVADGSKSPEKLSETDLLSRLVDIDSTFQKELVRIGELNEILESHVSLAIEEIHEEDRYPTNVVGGKRYT